MPNELKKLCSKFKKKKFCKKDFDDYFEVHNEDDQVDAEIQIEYSEEDKLFYNKNPFFYVLSNIFSIY